MMSSKNTLLKEIMEEDFRSIDLGLYLDTHTCDRDAIKIRNESVIKSAALKDEYEKCFGMLRSTQPSHCDTWEWAEGLWPWDEKVFKEGY